MRWSKLRVLVRERIAGSLRDRVDIHSAAYGNCSCGHAWLTLDGAVIANFCTRAYYKAQGYEAPAAKINSMYAGQFAEYGELSRQDAYKACWAFIHELSVEEALADADPLVQTLAVIDQRVGERRLAKIDPEQLHPLARRLFEERVLSELPSAVQGHHTALPIAPAATA